MSDIPNIPSATVIVPAHMQTGEALDKTKPADTPTLGNRASEAGSPPPSRLAKGNFITNLFKGGRPVFTVNLFKGGSPSLGPKSTTDPKTGEPKTVSVEEVRGKFAELKETYKLQIDVGNKAKGQGKIDFTTRTLDAFQWRADALEAKIAEHVEQNGDKQPFSAAETKKLIGRLKAMPRAFGDAELRTVFAKPKPDAFATKLTNRKVQLGAKKEEPARFEWLKAKFQSFKNLFRGTRPSERNAAKATTPATTLDSQKLSTEQLQNRQTPIDIEPAQNEEARIEQEPVQKEEARIEQEPAQKEEAQINPAPAQNEEAQIAPAPVQDEQIPIEPEPEPLLAFERNDLSRAGIEGKVNELLRHAGDKRKELKDTPVQFGAAPFSDVDYSGVLGAAIDALTGMKHQEAEQLSQEEVETFNFHAKALGDAVKDDFTDYTLVQADDKAV